MKNSHPCAGAHPPKCTTCLQFVSCAVTFTNGTTKAVPYQVPKSAQYTAVPDAGEAPDAITRTCCMPLSGEVAWYDSVKYSLYSSSSCYAHSRVCSLPGQVSAVWLCGCPGADCSGTTLYCMHPHMLIVLELLFSEPFSDSQIPEPEQQQQ